MKSKLIAIGALAAVAAVAPATTASAHIEVAVKSVKAHTDRADAGLDRAVSLFERNADRRGARELARSRRELGRATAEAAKLRRKAKTEKRRASAARATALVADQQDDNVEQLVGVLDEAGGRVENTIARTALFDTRGRDKALAILTELLAKGISSKSEQGIARAIAALSRDRDDEVVAEVKALISDEVSLRSKRTVARAVKVEVDGQRKAAAKLAELIASTEMPAASKPGLQRAYDAVVAEHGSVADILSRFSDRMPAEIRAFVGQVVTQARENAREMRQNRPTPPGGGPGTGPPGGGNPGTPPTGGGSGTTPPAGGAVIPCGSVPFPVPGC